MEADDYDVNPQVYSQYKFFAVPKSSAEISRLIRCLGFAEKVNISVSPAGIKMTVEEAKCLQVIAFLQKDIFQIFHLKDDDDFLFKISLKEMLDCLKKMSPEGAKASARPDPSQSGVKMQFLIQDEWSVFRMMLFEDTAVTSFQMKVEEYDDLIEFELTPVTVKVMMKSQEIYEYFKTLEDLAPDIIGFNISPSKSVVVSAECNEGSVEIIIPITSDAIESFECAEPIKTMYKLSNIKHAIKIMLLSTKCALKQDPRGVLCFNYLIEGVDSDSFVEYYCIPQVSDDQEDQFDY